MNESSAKISADEKYRYLLRRRWSSGPVVLWIMLNPSTADAMKDDPTIRRVRSFSMGRVGFGEFRVVNLFALRATDPSELERSENPVGPDNDATIAYEMAHAKMIVVAWGCRDSRLVAERARGVLEMLPRPLYCVGHSAGRPRRPLYVRGSHGIVPFVELSK